jgi:hypothetical protein
MIVDHYQQKWEPYVYPTPTVFPSPVIPSPITQGEIDEFRRLLEHARQYDREHHEPDCALEEKRAKIRDLARTLGIDVSFV